MKKKQIYEAVVTDRVDFQDKAKVRVVNAPDEEDNGTLVTVKNSIPGQKIEFRLKKQGKGDLVRVLEKSYLETADVCPVFGECGGCTYSSMDYDAQLKMKLDMVKRLISNKASNGQGGSGEESEETAFCIDEKVIEGIFASPLNKGYRNKMEYSFGDMEKGGELTLGLHRRGSRFDVINADKCILVHEDFNKIVGMIRKFFVEKKTPYFHKMDGEGYLRHLVLRRSEATGEILVNLVTTSAMDEDVEAELLQEFTNIIQSLGLRGTIAGIIHTVNDSIADVVKDEGTTVLYGKDYITEKILGLEFKITPFSFFQTNSKGAEVLYGKAREYALSGGISKSNEQLRDGGDADSEGCCVEEGTKPVIFDLYSGTGTIAQIMAPVAKKVYGVEIVEEAVEAASENAALNGLDNCEFIAGDVLMMLDEIEEKPDFIILDPPRDGVHPKALSKILDYGVENILYISCKPTSLARDLEVCGEAGYRVDRMCCVDMFPGTGHVETVVLLSREKVDGHIQVDLDIEELDDKLGISF